MDKENKPLCKSCRHWHKNGYSMGLCAISKEKNDVMFAHKGLYTKPDFYCKLFSEKNNKQL